ILSRDLPVGTTKLVVRSDIVAVCLNSSRVLSSLAAEVNNGTLRAHTVLGKVEGREVLSTVSSPKTVSQGNKVFVIARSEKLNCVKTEQCVPGASGIQLVVGEATRSTDGKQSGMIEWGNPRPLLENKTLKNEDKANCLFPGVGSGVLMEDSTLVFPVRTMNDREDEFFSMIVYSKDNGSSWALSRGMSPADCLEPLVTEWEKGQILMIVYCVFGGQRVYESRDMGTTWTEARGKLSGVWGELRSGEPQELSLGVYALITAAIEGRKVMLYTQRGYASWKKRTTALCLWVTDNNRTFYVGPVAMNDASSDELASTLLYSGGNLYLSRTRDSGDGRAISLSSLTEELTKIKSVLRTWAQKDTFFSSLSIPTAGLVAVLSDAANNDTWYDEYRCMHARVINATKVKDGFNFTGLHSGVLWPVNGWSHDVRRASLSHDFTLVASVTIQDVPGESVPLLTATLEKNNSRHSIVLSYTADKNWETGLKNKLMSSAWEPNKEYQLALTLQGKKALFYIKGQLLAEEEVPLTDEAPLELVQFCFCACSEKKLDQNSPVTVKKVLLYNRLLDFTEMSAIKERVYNSRAFPELQAKDVSQTIGPAGRGLLPLLVLLALWGIVAA
ncbi:trans-sialidase, putative, partial [Trypanosoma cruzi marinkellei]